MIFLKRCRPKRVIAIVLSVVIVFCSTLPTFAQTKQQLNNNQNKIEITNTQNKVIGIKGRDINMRNSEVITINGIQYRGKKMQVRATAYAGHQLTSTGGYAKVNRTIAVDPRIIPYKSKIYIPELNFIGVAEDCGSAIKQNRIDIFMATESQCIQWGIRNITIYVLE